MLGKEQAANMGILAIAKIILGLEDVVKQLLQQEACIMRLNVWSKAIGLA